MTQYGPLAPQGPALSPVGVGVAPNQAISKQEIYEAMCRRRANWNFTDGGTIGTGVAEEPVYCVPSVISAQGIATGVSQGFTVKQFWVESLVALASGITYGSAGWTVTISKRSPSITGQGAAVIASATTQTGDPALGAGSNAFQPVSVPISGAGVATTIGAASFSQAITAATPFTLTVASTAGFPPQGAGYVTNTSGVLVPFSYTGIGSATTLTGCQSSTGTLGASALPVTTGAYTQCFVAAGSNNAALPQATINVNSTVGFQPASATAPGYITITLATGINVTVSYTGLTSTSFTGCALAAGSPGGTLTTGVSVQGPLIALLAPGDVLTFTLTKVAAGLAIGSATAQASAVVEIEES